MKDIIEVKNLCKSFGKVDAVNDLSFCVKEGELFAFLGINGAGKSTTISMICGTLKKDSGEIFVDGHNIETEKDCILNKIGVVFQNSVLDQELTVIDNLTIKASYYNMNKKMATERIEELATALDFKDLFKRKVGKLSGGQRRKIDIARALLNEPKVLILDEPTTGLDPQTRKKLWSFIHDLRKKKGMTVFLTTHYMEEAADADYVLIIDSGKMVDSGTPLELKNKYTGDYITLYNVKEEEVIKLNHKYSYLRDAFRISVKDTNEAKELIVNNYELFKDFEVEKGKMDDVFLNATGKKLGGDDK